MPRNTCDLSALSWQMGTVPRQPFDPQPVDDRAAVAEWLPARVPGDVRADLIAAGRIPPVETPEGIAAGAWVDACDWWYRVTLPGDYAGDEMLFLEADGIDYYSATWLDGRRLAVHAGMFARQVVPLSPEINAARPHELAIRIWGGGALPRQPNPPWRRAIRRLVSVLSPGTEYFPDRMTTPKAQFSFGWDFAPRLLSTGIWDGIRLVSCRGAYIEDLHACAEPLTEADDPTPVQWRLTLHVRGCSENDSTGPPPTGLRCRVTIEPEGFGGAPIIGAEHPFPSRPTGDGAAWEGQLTLLMPVAWRWWPWDQGEPRCYRVTVQLVDARGVLDELSLLTGVRSVRQEWSSGSPSRQAWWTSQLAAFRGKPRRPDAQGNVAWRFVLNGRPVFLRGANWTPADVLPGRVTGADTDRLLNMARAAGINFLRVWGGGIREKRAFWAACDRLGIMAWQEFPLACAFLDHYPRDRAYLDTLAQEARGIVRALRNHPSLIAWCGGNEFNIGRERLPLAALAQAAAGDATRPFIPASPAAGEVHQWQVWHGFAPWTTLAHETAALMAEFGVQALPAAETIAEMFPDGAPASLDDPRWAGRKAQVAKLHWYAGPQANGSLPDAIEATQRAQATALQAGIEACRLRRDPALLPCPENGFTCHSERVYSSTQVTAQSQRSRSIPWGRVSLVAPRSFTGGSPSRALSGQPAHYSDIFMRRGGMCHSKGNAAQNNRCSGVAFWQFNEPWPAVSWAVIDRAGRSKLAFEMLRRAFQPALVAARFPWRRYSAGDEFAAEIWLVNDAPEARPGCTVEARLDGQIVWSQAAMTLPAAGAQPAGQFSIRLAAAPRELTLTLQQTDVTLAENRYDLAIYLPPNQPRSARLTRWLADRLLGAGHG